MVIIPRVLMILAITYRLDVAEASPSIRFDGVLVVSFAEDAFEGLSDHALAFYITIEESDDVSDTASVEEVNGTSSDAELLIT